MGECVVIELFRLPVGARPKQHPVIEDLSEVDDHRHLTCRYYAECLDFAAHCRWRGFTCAACPRFPSATTRAAPGVAAAKRAER